MIHAFSNDVPYIDLLFFVSAGRLFTYILKMAEYFCVCMNQHIFFAIVPSSVKMVNQLLAGVHIASAAEAMAFGARLNLRTRRVFEIIQHARGYSWYVSIVNHLTLITLAS